MRLGAAILMTTLGLFVSSGFAQTLPPKKSVAVPTEQKAAPTLGFNSRKDVYPVFETAMYGMAMNENELRRKSEQVIGRINLLLNDPDLRFDPPRLGDPRRDVWQKDMSQMQKDLSQIATNLVEAARMRQHRDSLMQDFLGAFRDSKECKGITFYTSEKRKPAFTVQLSVAGASSNNQTWGWWLRWPGDPSPANRDGHGFGGTGSQSSAKLAARDVCLKIWDDVNPNRSSKSGGRFK